MAEGGFDEFEINKLEEKYPEHDKMDNEMES